MVRKSYKIFFLGLVLICSLQADWLSPTSATTPSGNWTNLANAYDNDTSTYASDNFATPGWAGFIELSLPGNVTSNQLKVLADFGQNGVDTVNIEVYNIASANWQSVRNGSINDGEWSYVTFNTQVISRVRFQYHYINSGLIFWLYELAVWNAGSGTITPAVLTKLATSEDDGGGVIHGQIVDDGYSPCQCRFEYGLTSGYGQATAWTGSLTAGQDFSTQLTGLTIGEYYHYRAEAKNSAGTAYGQDRYFWAKQPNLGWLSPTGTSDTTNVWENPSLAHDDDTNTYARALTTINDPSVWSPFLYLTHTVITSNAVRFNGRVDGLVDQVDIDVNKDGAWTDIYQGTAANSTYNIYAFTTGSVTQARIRFHKSGNYGMYYSLAEFDFYKQEQAQNAPTITVNPVMNLLWVNDLIQENGESTTRFIIRRNMNELYAGKIKIDGPALGITYTEDYTGILVTKNEFGLPLLTVSSANNSFGAFVNNHPTKNVLLEFNLEQQIQPLLMLDPGAGSRTITNYWGQERAGLPTAYRHHVSSFNYTVDLKRISFYTEYFSTFSVGAISTVNVTPSGTALSYNNSLTLNIQVLDSLGSGVESAPVTVSLLSGSGTLSSSNLTTDASGNAWVVYTAPAVPITAVIQVVSDTKAGTSILNIGTITTVNINLQPDEKIITPSSLLLLTVSVTQNDGSPATGVSVTVSIISGGGTLSSTNLTTNTSGNAYVTYTAPAAYGIAQIKAQCLNAAQANTFYIQNGTIRYVPLGWGGIPSYNTIQAALNACAAGDTVLVHNGRYNEQLTWPNVSNILLSGEDDSGSRNCIISANNTTQCIYNGNAVNLTVKNMYLTNGNNGGAGNQRYGGGITIYDGTNTATLNLLNVTVSQNQTTLSTAARQLGAGIYFIGRYLNIVESYIANNTANGTNGGGGIYVSNGSVKITDSQLLRNIAAVGAGGALYLPNTTTITTINNCIFDSNKAITNGGAVYQGNIIADSCTFNANTATQNGGVFAQAIVSLNSCVFSGNACVNDGGVLYGNALAGSNYITDSLFLNNHTGAAAGADGGCFWYSDNTAVLNISDSVISNNFAANGGFCFESSVTANRCFFSNNRAINGSGGAFYQTALTVNSSVFVSHNATTSGGVFRSNGVLNIVHCTIVSNNAPAGQGQVIFRSAGTPVMRNSIVLGSSSPFNDTTPVITYSLLPASYTGAGNITGNPLFKDVNGRDYRLTFKSPCVNTATNNIPAVAYDLLGNSRLIYDKYDMGAYEYAEIFLSAYTPSPASTDNATAQVSFRLRDYQHASANINLSLTVNNTPLTTYSVVSYSATASTDMRVRFPVTFNTNTTYNVTVNILCTAAPEFVQDYFWFSSKRISPNIVILKRSMTVSRSAEYTGQSLTVPGSAVTYFTVLQNQTSGNAYNCTISDRVPRNTHFYYQTNISPTLNGTGLSNIQYLGPVNNSAGVGTEVKYKFDMNGNSTATFNYSVTVD